MPITVTKTWEYVVDVSVSAADLTTRNRTLMLRLKEALTNTGALQAVDAANANISLTAPWTVVQSSNGVTADASDNWASVADVINANAGSAHAWMHMRQTDYFASGDHLHLLLDFINAGDGSLARVSWTRGATGYNADGTITDRPTHAETTPELVTRDGTTDAGDEETSDSMWGSDSSNTPAVLHLRIADDGSAGSWFIAAAGFVVNFQGWQDDEEGRTTRVHPFHVWALGQDSNQDTIHWVNALNSIDFIRTIDDGGTARQSYVSQSCFSAVEQRVTDFNATSSRMLTPAYICNDAMVEILSIFTDIWWGSSLEASGDGSPQAGPFTRRQVGEMVIPYPSGAAMAVS